MSCACLRLWLGTAIKREGRRSWSRPAACGVPAVASDVGGIREWIDDGRNGLMVPPRDPLALAHALAELLKQPEHLRRMGQAAHQKALETSWSAVADRYAEFTFSAIERAKMSKALGDKRSSGPWLARNS